MENEMIQIPKDISEVNADLCRRVFVEICGGGSSSPRFGVLNQATFAFRLTDIWSNMDIYFNPFLNIQDTKLCDPWLVENKLCITSYYPKRTGKDFRIMWHFKIRDDFLRDLIGWCDDVSEPFARMCAILKAYNKITGG
jgi:hypothetical protein